ncbi:MAG: nucleoside deaminase, partial [Rhizobiales bacterium]|nr:nucleoside deaminase [Hyphomicrobiales bacterium]
MSGCQCGNPAHSLDRRTFFAGAVAAAGAATASGFFAAPAQAATPSKGQAKFMEEATRLAIE